ncbi:DNA translocase FtsK [Trichinella spiralis]|uniref:Uncharacterized protein n=2 Tax=Trichinella spiralis TaxID=6334 RepID=A0A0V1AU35_TRISP|nr:hypothetical protein T01_9252 [Trichinella spiralis]
MRFTNARHMHALLGRLKIIRLLLSPSQRHIIMRFFEPVTLNTALLACTSLVALENSLPCDSDYFPNAKLSTLHTLFGKVVGWKGAKFFPSNCTFCWSTLAHNRMENLQFEVSQLCMVTPSNAQSA